MQNILELKHIFFSTEGKSILKDVSFSVKKGEIISIIGMNGTGKSTLLKIIAGIYKKNSGNIIKNYKTLSYVPQKLNIEQTFPIEVLEFIQIYNTNISLKKITSAFQKFQAEELLKKNMSVLSGGELQKVLVISALLQEPEIILLDEPTAGIDVIGEENFYENIHKIREMFPETAILIVSHNLHLVYKHSDRVICLHKNNYCCHGTPTEIQKNKEVEKIFGNYMLPYEHNPHEKHEH